MTQLQIFTITNNSFVGTIPSNITHLVNLFQLFVSLNHFTGTLPHRIGDMRSLYSLSVEDNKFSGTIPASLCEIRTLDNLHFAHNRLSGTIPDCLFNTSAVKTIFVNENRLTGRVLSVPLPVGYRSKLAYLDVSGNKLTGSIPYDLILAGSPSLQSVALSKNCFSGELSSLLCSATHLTAIAMDGINTQCGASDSTGSIPQCFFELAALTTLHLSGNRLTGWLIRCVLCIFGLFIFIF
jgi:Leucine-rich repeat (LRR) protein